MFRERFDTDDAHERATFLRSKTFDWIAVTSDEKKEFAAELRACMPWGTKEDTFKAESWFKVSYPQYSYNSGQSTDTLGAMVHCARSGRVAKSVHTARDGFRPAILAN